MLNNSFAVGCQFNEASCHLKGTGGSGGFLKRISAGDDASIKGGGDVGRNDIVAEAGDKVVGNFGAGASGNVHQIDGAEVLVGSSVVDVDNGSVIKEIGMFGEQVAELLEVGGANNNGGIVGQGTDGNFHLVFGNSSPGGKRYVQPGATLKFFLSGIFNLVGNGHVEDHFGAFGRAGFDLGRASEELQRAREMGRTHRVNILSLTGGAGGKR